MRTSMRISEERLNMLFELRMREIVNYRQLCVKLDEFSRKLKATYGEYISEF